MEHKNNVIRPSFNRQQSYTAMSGDSALRETLPYLDRYQQEQLERQKERQKRWEKQIHKRAVQKEFEERRAKSSALTFTEASIVSIICILFFAACIFYVGQLAQLNKSQKQIASLQSTYASIAEDNNARSSQIEGMIDHEWIYDYATQTLGMMYPEKGQTVTYKKDAGSYVKQSEAIPSK